MTSCQQGLLEKLYQGQTLSRSESSSLFSELIQGKMAETCIAAMLIALKVRGETIDEITGAADALRKAAKAFPKTENLTQGIIDIVGTGGDGHNTINISTTAAFVAAAAGAKVAKHGNRSVSSKSGSSDVLATLGIDLTMKPEAAAQCLDDFGLCFLFAPHYHGGVKHAISVRQQLKTRTLFNILGPLINPAKPDYMLLGVYSKELITPIAKTLNALGVKRAMVVHGSGLDEVALHGTTFVAELKDGDIKHYQLSPADFGVDSAPISSLEGGTPDVNAVISQHILQGNGQQAHMNAVAINAACALYLAGISTNIKDGTKTALNTLNSGKAWKLVNKLANASASSPATNIAGKRN